tara:strand:+ start:104 stop:307 length:204 start_codon:yes stop_codon:yes gene_type:complete
MESQSIVLNNQKIIKQLNKLDPKYEYDIRYSVKINMEGLTQEKIDDPNYDLSKHSTKMDYELIRKEV